MRFMCDFLMTRAIKNHGLRHLKGNIEPTPKTPVFCLPRILQISVNVSHLITNKKISENQRNLRENTFNSGLNIQIHNFCYRNFI
jgi:hypothetical protein